MVDEILPNLYRIEIPLPGSPLKVLNSYVIKAPDRCLLIDAGWDHEECMRTMSDGLEKLDVDIKKTDIFLTHMHADHLGLVTRLATHTSKVYFNRKEASLVGLEWRREEIYKAYLANGFPEEELKRSMAKHPGLLYGLKRHIDFHFLKENDTLEIGDYSFRCIETPGHSPGHICLHDARKKVLVSGDHILIDITPNIAYWVEMHDSLKQYLTSLDKVYDLDADITLPGHRRLMSDHKERIRELREHHRARLNEVLSALKEGDKTAFEVAPYITWDIACRSWKDFPIQQKWFAFGETLAHLFYLLDNGTISKRTKDLQVVFSLA